MNNVYTVKHAEEDETYLITESYDAAKVTARVLVASLIVSDADNQSVRIFKGYDLLGYYCMELVHIEEVKV